MYRKYCELLGSTPGSAAKKFRESKDQQDAASKSGNKEKSTGKENISMLWKEYVYGNKRRRPRFWERDQDKYKKLWKKIWKGSKNKKSPPSSRDSSPEPKPKPPPRPAPKPPKPEKLLRVLHVKEVDINAEENAKNHKTDLYDCMDKEDEDGKDQVPELIARRGFFFKITLTFDRPYNKKDHDMKIGFHYGEDPKRSKGTLVVIKVDEDGKTSYKPDEWGAYLEGRNGKAIDVMVYIPANCIIGEWGFWVRTISKGKNKFGKNKTKIFQWEFEDDITVIFNPWCKDDIVYMKDQDLLKEYILNRSGCVYRGNAWCHGAKPWNFGQFEKGILDICLYLIRCGFQGKATKAMADPIKVSRILAKMVNSCDDNGVLIGNWSGEYSDGISPSAWGGSPKILHQFMESGPVKYGQCWVFSCLLTTVCRSVGIPCRTVTNFASAHDTDGSNSIEKILHRVDGVLEKHPYLSGDSVWNFHVWNEVWLKRTDLGIEEYNGWQVIDATPQEESGGTYTCGPCPVAAIKKGDCTVQYDTGFVFSEVNADSFDLELMLDGTYKTLKHSKKKIGMNISTKIPDGRPFKDETYGVGGFNFDRNAYDEKKREDVTCNYKHPEGSPQEREAVLLAHKTARNPREGAYEVKDEKQDIKFSLIHSNELLIGSSLPITLVAKNVGSRERSIPVTHIRVAPKTYQGDAGKFFVIESFPSKSLAPGEETEYKVEVTVDQYKDHMVEQANLYIEASALVSPVDGEPDSKQDCLKAHDFRFRRPDLDLDSPNQADKGKQVTFKVSFKNPLPHKLTQCSMSMESSGFKNIMTAVQPDVETNSMYEQEFTMVSRKKGEHAIVFTFDCKELKDISGCAFITIV